MESIANGRPVLGARRGGIPELIEAGKTGWLFPAGNKTVLAETIREDLEQRRAGKIRFFL